MNKRTGTVDITDDAVPGLESVTDTESEGGAAADAEPPPEGVSFASAIRDSKQQGISYPVDAGRVEKMELLDNKEAPASPVLDPTEATRQMLENLGVGAPQPAGSAGGAATTEAEAVQDSDLVDLPSQPDSADAMEPFDDVARPADAIPPEPAGRRAS